VSAASDRDVSGTAAKRALDLAKRFGHQTKWHRWEFHVKVPECRYEAVAGKHRVHHDRHFGFESLLKSLNSGAQHLRAVRDGFRLGNDRFPSLGEFCAPRRPAIEEGNAQLGFESVNRVADGRGRTLKAPRGACEATGFRDK
jgi:hypothetical protein